MIGEGADTLIYVHAQHRCLRERPWANNSHGSAYELSSGLSNVDGCCLSYVVVRWVSFEGDRIRMEKVRHRTGEIGVSGKTVQGTVRGFNNNLQSPPFLGAPDLGSHQMGGQPSHRHVHHASQRCKPG